ncbi:MAG: gliding motility lipoprotein GldH [Chitinophagaceae bacterium]|nr:gliding motility lipoprotein GldH [Chitinophagaceae bacterium]
MAACSPIDLFEKTVAIPNQTWYNTYKPSFTFAITDTTSLYNIFLVLRHTDSYKYNNIWLNISSDVAGDSIHFQNLNIALGSDATGWEGNGMDDIFDIRKPITNGPVAFKKTGKYTFAISQIMRENPLTSILNVGILVEKVKM